MFRYLFLILLVACGASSPKAQKATNGTDVAQKVAAPKFKTAKIKAVYPHDSTAYCQGLLFYKGKLYESTGGYGSSDLRRVDMVTGKIEKKERLSDNYFGEGLTVVGDRLVQLTWREGRAFSYDINSFKRVATNSIRGEGWGVVFNNGELYVSDGSYSIAVLDPKTFKLKRLINVHSERGAVENLNELEWINGRIWANIYTTSLIAVINPDTGVVEQMIDCTPLEREVKNFYAEVLNGIAYDSLAGRIVVTGKNWDKLFEIEL